MTELQKPLGAHLWKALAVDQLTEAGEFRGYLSTWDVDKDGERFARGSFTKSIFDYVAADTMPAILYGHDFDSQSRSRQFNTENIVGRVTSMQEDDRGLLITGRVDVSTERGQNIRKAMKRGLLSLSVGFVAHRWHHEDGVKTFDEAEVLEASLTPTPANPQAVILEVKSSEEVAALRAHLRNSHSVSKVSTSGKTQSELITMHRLAHANVPAPATHLQTGEVYGDAEVVVQGRRSREQAKAIAQAREKVRLAKLSAKNDAMLAQVAFQGQFANPAEELAAENARQQEKADRALQASLTRDAERDEELARIEEAERQGRAAFQEEFRIGEVTG